MFRYMLSSVDRFLPNYSSLCTNLSEIAALSLALVPTSAVATGAQLNMAELYPLMPSTDGALGSIIVEPQDAPAPVPITDQEVGEYREQDRYLPVRDVFLLSLYPKTHAVTH
jgi:hypothetical protein